MIKKLKQKSGETLIETLFSMMIAVLCMGILCTAVMAAANINKSTREMDKKFSDELNAVEGMSAEIPVEEQDIEITFQPTDGSQSYTENAKVNVYGGEDGAFLSYDYEGEAP